MHRLHRRSKRHPDLQLRQYADERRRAPGGTSDNKFLVHVVARVLNVSTPLNQVGSTLHNTASLIYDRPSAGANQSVSAGSQTVTVIEPRITTTKTVSPTGTCRRVTP